MSFLSSIFGNHSFFSNTPNPNSNANQLPVSTHHNTPKGGWLDSVEDSTITCTSLKVYDLSGNELILGEKDEKGSGGEGTVYEFPANPKYMVKIYKDDILKNSRKIGELRKRILDMVAISDRLKAPFIAWPIMPVHNARREIIGFAMLKCTGNSLLSLRGPRFIKQHFPNWTRRELALTALDYIKKVRLLAANNILINDFNPANFLVNEKCEVSFIDCDSYQVPGQDGSVNLTRTYFPSHVAPELLNNKRLLDVPRNIHHVEFGVALTVFNILMCGLHPYNYCDPIHNSACGTPDENLMKGRCPLGVGSGFKLPAGGWYNLWSWLTYKLKDTFIRMFRDGHSNPAVRPDLETLQMNVEELLHAMTLAPERTNLTPANPKSSERKTPSAPAW